jgi:hypothetical protein
VEAGALGQLRCNSRVECLDKIENTLFFGDVVNDVDFQSVNGIVSLRRHLSISGTQGCNQFLTSKKSTTGLKDDMDKQAFLPYKNGTES